MSNRERPGDRPGVGRPAGEVDGEAPPDRDYLQIGEVAELTGLTQRTLRYYEELQLLDPPTRMAGGFRLYSPADVARLQHVVRLKQLLGFSLAEIKEIIATEEDLARWQSGAAPTTTRRRLEQVDSMITTLSGQLDALGRKITQMEQFRADLAARLRALERKRTVIQAEHEGAQLHAASEYG